MTRTSTLQGRRAADPLELALLQDAQQLGLHGRRQLADLVEEQRAAVAPARSGRGCWPVGPGEGAPLVAEQLALEQRLRQGRAVDRDEAARSARRSSWWMAAGDQLLAGAALAGDEHRGLGGRDLGGERQRLAEGAARGRRSARSRTARRATSRATPPARSSRRARSCSEGQAALLVGQPLVLEATTTASATRRRSRRRCVEPVGPALAEIERAAHPLAGQRGTPRAERAPPRRAWRSPGSRRSSSAHIADEDRRARADLSAKGKSVEPIRRAAAALGGALSTSASRSSSRPLEENRQIPMTSKSIAAAPPRRADRTLLDVEARRRARASSPTRAAAQAPALPLEQHGALDERRDEVGHLRSSRA